MDLYKAAVRPLLFSGFKTDPEWIHHRTLGLLSWLDQQTHTPNGQWLQKQLQQSFQLRDPRLEQTLWGLKFPNPLGLAAGFDKNGDAADVWGMLGFGFAELGTVTLHAQPGNPVPRLFRLPWDQAVLNRMGFNNRGAAVMAAKLSAARNHQPSHLTQSAILPKIPLGINLGKSKVTPLEEAPADYLGSFQLLQNWGDYFVVNVSSPNTPGLRSLQAADQLAAILAALQDENQGRKPLFLKIAPDLEWDAIAEVLAVVQTYQLTGIIATNTTISRTGLKTDYLEATGTLVTEEPGGISGAPLRKRSTEIIRFIWQQTQGKLPIIGTGGIFSAEDAWEKITAGASLLEVYTGLVYEGPWMMQRILSGLLQKLESQGMTHISQAVGQSNQ